MKEKREEMFIKKKYQLLKTHPQWVRNHSIFSLLNLAQVPCGSLRGTNWCQNVMENIGASLGFPLEFIYAAGCLSSSFV